MGITLKKIGMMGLGLALGVAATLQLSAQAQLAPPASPLPLDELRQITTVYGLIRAEYVEPVEGKKLLSEAISRMVSSLDRNSVYLDQRAYREMREAAQGKFVGPGLEVALDEGYVKVVSPIEDGPAFRAGVKAGDLLTRIDNTPVRGLTLDQVSKKLRGDPKTKLTLTLARKGEDLPLIVPLQREDLHLASVKGKIIEPGYAWLRISQFQEQTLPELSRKVAALYAQEPELKGLVLDLRNDPGGLVAGAIGVSAAFLPQPEVVVSSAGQLPGSNVTYYGRREFYAPGNGADPLATLPAALKRVPLVVLVNYGSASAAEIVAGALQDYQRATILGTQTFGMGSVQSLRQLTPDTAVKLTTARYLTPKGRAIQARGIVPDLMVDENADGDGIPKRPVLLDDKADAKADNKADAKAAPARDELAEARRVAAMLKNRKPLDFGGKDDFQLAQALRHFKGLPLQLSKVEPTPAKDEPRPAPPPALPPPVGK